MPEFILDVTEEEFEKAGSKFASVGEHLSEVTNVDWENPGTSIKFEFRIVAEGPDSGKEAKIVAGVSKSAMWKLKEILEALGVQYQVKNGKVTFDSAVCLGKQFKSVWTEQVDSRTPEEGGKGTKYTKATGAIGKDETLEGLGI